MGYATGGHCVDDEGNTKGSTMVAYSLETAGNFTLDEANEVASRFLPEEGWNARVIPLSDVKTWDILPPDIQLPNT